jgi:acetyl-CoA carboxylase biotin carboxyl carrier protein
MKLVNNYFSRTGAVVAAGALVMELDQDDVLQILKLINESKFAELRLEMGELKLIVKKGGPVSVEGLGPLRADVMGPEAVEGQIIAPGDPEAEVEIAESSNVGARETQQTEEEEEVLEATERLTSIRAPMMGVFYRAPAPGAAVFVEVKTFVTEYDSVGIIELMKLFYTIKSGVRGTIARICVEDAQPVKEGQVLFLVTPNENEPLAYDADGRAQVNP